jgi:hypothetical protein
LLQDDQLAATHDETAALRLQVFQTRLAASSSAVLRESAIRFIASPTGGRRKAQEFVLEAGGYYRSAARCGPLRWRRSAIRIRADYEIGALSKMLEKEAGGDRKSNRHLAAIVIRARKPR